MLNSLSKFVVDWKFYQVDIYTKDHKKFIPNINDVQNFVLVYLLVGSQ